MLDAQWCPGNSTAFAAATAGGRLEIWDVAVSTLKPVARHVSARARMTAVSFAPAGAPVVVAGGADGGLLVFRHFNVFGERGEGREAQVARLEEALRANAVRGPAAAGGAAGAAAGGGGEGAAAGAATEGG